MSDSKSFIRRVYEDHYKALLIIPALLVVCALLQIGWQYSTTGEFLHRGVSLKGGLTLTLPEISADPVALQNVLDVRFPTADASVRKITEEQGLIIDASDVDAEALLVVVQEQVGELNAEDYGLEQVGSSLGESFFKQTFLAMLIAFVLMGLVVLITFKHFISSAIVLLAAASDIVVTLAILNILGIRMSTAGIAALLMLIGYSVDSDIILSTRVLKRKDATLMENVYSSTRTGLMMTATTLGAVVTALILSESSTITEIMTVLFIGLLVDVIMTYIQNAGLLRMYMEKK